MSDRLITISLVSGAIQVSMTSLTTKPSNNDTLRFKCIGGDFAVFYKHGRSPYQTGETVISEQKGVETKKLKIRKLTAGEQGFPVTDPQNGATFPYGIAVLNPANQQIVVKDPDIIIDDPGGGGGSGGSGGGGRSGKKKATKKKN
jgi:hypothetical protein